MKKIIIFGVLVVLLLSSYLVIKEIDQKSPLLPLKSFGIKILQEIGIYEKIEFKDPTSQSDFIIEEFLSGLKNPTTMTFIGDDILVLQKNDGTVRLIRNEILIDEPLLDVEVANLKELGMLGILSVEPYVYIYYTEAKKDGDVPLRNVIYKYYWDGENLSNPILINELPVYAFSHVGGVLTLGIDGSIFSVTGDQTRTGYSCETVIDYEKYPNYPCRVFGENNGIFHNMKGGKMDDTGMIFRVGLDETEPRPMYSSNQMEHYFAIGIRNSFGLAIDPVTGNLWMTENGPDSFDEINLVTPGFNSGWKKVIGPANKTQIQMLSSYEGFHYEDPKFSWEQTVNPTAISFIDSPKFEKYKEYVLVGDCYGRGTGHLFLFKLNEDRDGFIFEDPGLQDLVVDLYENEGNLVSESMDEIIIAKDMGCVTDIEFGPDGYPYIISHFSGKIFKMIPNN